MTAWSSPRLLRAWLTCTLLLGLPGCDSDDATGSGGSGGESGSTLGDAGSAGQTPEGSGGADAGASNEGQAGATEGRLAEVLADFCALSPVTTCEPDCVALRETENTMCPDCEALMVAHLECLLEVPEADYTCTEQVIDTPPACESTASEHFNCCW
jgi:hypothetical protein